MDVGTFKDKMEKLFTEFQEQEKKTHESWVLDNVTKNPKWAVARILYLELENARLQAECNEWQNDYWGVTPDERRRGL